MPRCTGSDLPATGRAMWLATAVAAVLFIAACGGTGRGTRTDIPLSPATLGRIGYTVQVGSFRHMENAIRLTESLRSRGVSAYYFVHAKGIYRVRFGDFPSRSMAELKARKLRKAGIIGNYYIVSPREYAVSRGGKYGRRHVRESLVRTARSFLGVPYRWGGSSRRGLDCSGLAMSVYMVNGIRLPRSSRAQYGAGRPVGMAELRKGDLVFFATSGGRRVSHVGIYIGGGKFIHAPNRGKRVRIDSLSNGYYRKTFVGARTYL